MVRPRIDREYDDLQKMQLDEEEEEEDSEEESEEDETEYAEDFEDPLLGKKHFGAYCGKMLFVFIVLITLFLCCWALISRAELDIDELELKRAKSNKRNQLLSVGLLMESLTEEMQNTELKEDTIASIAQSLNEQYLTGSYEVLVVKYLDCPAPPCPDSIHILTDLRHQESCGTDEANVARCRMQYVAGVGDTALQVTDPMVVDTVLALDYTDDERDALYTYKKLKGTDLGLILKQTHAEAVGSSAVKVRLRWLSLTIFFAFALVIGFFLFLSLKYLQAGKGNLAMAALILTSLCGVFGIPAVTLYIESLDEGVLQQVRETDMTAAIVMSAYNAAYGSPIIRDALQPAMQTLTLMNWMSKLNNAVGSPYEGLYFYNEPAPGGRDIHPVHGMAPEDIRFPHATKRVCTHPICQDTLRQQLADITDASERSLASYEGREVNLYGSEQKGLMAAKLSMRTDAEGHYNGFAWMVKRSFVTDRFKTVVSDLKKRMAVLMCGYVVAAVIASILTCLLLPTGGGRNKPHLSRAMPVVAVGSIAFVMLLVVIVTGVGLEGMGLTTQTYERVAHSSQVALNSSYIRGQVAVAEKIFARGMVETDRAKKDALKDEFLAQSGRVRKSLRLLHPMIAGLYGKSSPVAAMVDALPDSIEEVENLHFVPIIDQRATTVLESNASFTKWCGGEEEGCQWPDVTMKTAREALTNIKNSLEAAGLSRSAEEYAKLVDIENDLYAYEVIFRQSIILNQFAEGEGSPPTADQEFAALTADFHAKIAEVRSQIKELTEAGTLTLDTLRINFWLDNVKTSNDKYKRELNDYTNLNKESRKLEEALQAFVHGGYHDSTPTPELVLFDNAMSLATEVRTIPMLSFFETVKGQMQMLATNARIIATREADLPFTLDFEETRVRLATDICFALLVLTMSFIMASFYVYTKDARCQTGPRGATLVPYPWIEIRDFSIMCVFVLAVLVSETVIVRQYTLRRYDDVREKLDVLYAKFDPAMKVAAWNTSIEEFTAQSSAFVLSAHPKHLKRMEALKGDVFTAAAAVHMSPYFNPTDKLRILGTNESVSQVFDKSAAAVKTREEYDSRYDTHRYDTLRLLVRDRLVDEEHKAFLANLQAQKKLETLSREAWIAMHEQGASEEIVKYITAGTETVRTGRRVVWEPRYEVVEVAKPYKFVFRNDADGAVTLDVGSLVKNSAVKSVTTASSEWVVPTLSDFTLQPDAELTVSFTPARAGEFEFVDQDGNLMLAVQATGTHDAGLDVGISDKAEELAGDPRADRNHGVWRNTHAKSLFMPVVGGGVYSSEGPHNGFLEQLEVGRPYKLALTNDGEHCVWEIDQEDRYCSPDVAHDFEPMSKEECAIRVRGEVRCANLMVSSERVGNSPPICRCVIAGGECDYQFSKDNNNVYKLNCDPLAAQTTTTKLDVSALEGHVIYREVGDEHVAVRVPSLISLGLRYVNETVKRGSKSTYVTVLPLELGKYEFTVPKAADAAAMTATVGIVRPCFRHEKKEECFAQIECAWDGRLCKQIEPLEAREVNQTSSLLSKETLLFVYLHKAFNLLQTNHLAYLLSAKTQYLELSKQHAEEFRTTLHDMHGLVTRSLEGQFDSWLMASHIERDMRVTLSNTLFLEDAFLKDVNQSPLLEQVEGNLQALENGLVLSGLGLSSGRKKVVFWTCCLAAWLVGLVIAVMIPRLDVAVRLSKDFSFQNVPTAHDFRTQDTSRIPPTQPVHRGGAPGVTPTPQALHGTRPVSFKR